MDMFTTERIIEMVDVLATEAIKNEVYFCELDSHAGDGDFGMSLAKGFKQLKSEWGELDTSSIGAFLKACGMIITEYCGGASGPIWGTAFMSAARYSKGKETLTPLEFAEMMKAAADGIMKRGGAKLGDKTLLDALIPSVEVMLAAAGNNAEIKQMLLDGAKAAVDGALKTKDIVATKGRASYLGERSISFPDAGATAIGILFTEIAEKY